jgi:Tol biopolymer transport system component
MQQAHGRIHNKALRIVWIGVVVIGIAVAAIAAAGCGGTTKAGETSKTETTPKPTKQVANTGGATGPSGRIAYDCGSPPGICVMNADGSDPRRLTHSGNNEGASWSPDGSQLVFSRLERPTGAFQIFVMNADGSGLRRVTKGNGNKLFVEWSPDGDRFVLASDRNGSFDLYVTDTEGRILQQLTKSHLNEFDPAWTPDGKAIVFASDRFGGSIYLMKLGGRPRMLLQGLSPALSPDGSLLAVVTPGGIELINLTDGSALVPTEGQLDQEPAWSSDGRWLAFRRGKTGQDAEIYVVRRDGTDAHLLTDGSGTSASPAWSPR